MHVVLPETTSRPPQCEIVNGEDLGHDTATARQKRQQRTTE